MDAETSKVKSRKKAAEERVAPLMVFLSQCTLPATAVEIADALKIATCRESRRRRIREAIVVARETHGYKICADGDGYWLARSSTEWKDYEAARKRGARFIFVHVARTKAAVVDRANEQKTLFATRGSLAFG